MLSSHDGMNPYRVPWGSIQQAYRQYLSSRNKTRSEGCYLMSLRYGVLHMTGPDASVRAVDRPFLAVSHPARRSISRNTSVSSDIFCRRTERVAGVSRPMPDVPPVTTTTRSRHARPSERKIATDPSTTAATHGDDAERGWARPAPLHLVGVAEGALTP